MADQMMPCTIDPIQPRNLRSSARVRVVSTAHVMTHPRARVGWPLSVRRLSLPTRCACACVTASYVRAVGCLSSSSPCRLPEPQGEIPLRGATQGPAAPASRRARRARAPMSVLRSRHEWRRDGRGRRWPRRVAHGMGRDMASGNDAVPFFRMADAMPSPDSQFQ
jgi:hypothetical protein